MNDDLHQALGAIVRAERDSVALACKAGEQVARAKQWLKDHPLVLQSWTQWFRMNCKDYSLRSANDYEKVYMQINKDSSICYPSIRACLDSWREDQCGAD
jgi:hypothetical protein